jgi:hypothetical protein
MPQSETRNEGGESVRRRWVAVLDIAWRVLLVVVGIPAVWILRAAGVIHLSGWHAVGVSAVLLLIAVGETFLAMVGSA